MASKRSAGAKPGRKKAVGTRRASGAAGRSPKDLCAEGTSALEAGDLAKARNALSAAAEGFHGAGAEGDEALCLHRLGLVLLHLDRLDDAARALEAAQEIRSRLGDERAMADSIHVLAQVCIASRDFAKARQLSDVALAIQLRIGDAAGAASSRLLRGASYAEEGLRDEAIQGFREALQAMKAMRELYGASLICHNLSRLAEREGKLLSAFKFQAARAALLSAAGHPETPRAEACASMLALRAGLVQAEIRKVMEAAVASFVEDDGEALIREAFGPIPQAPSGPAPVR